MSDPSDNKTPEDPDSPLDAVADAVEDVVEEVDEGLEQAEDLGHAMDDAVEEFAEDNPLAYRIFMWAFTLVLLIVVAWLCARYYGNKASLTP